MTFKTLHVYYRNNFQMWQRRFKHCAHARRNGVADQEFGADPSPREILTAFIACFGRMRLECGMETAIVGRKWIGKQELGLVENTNRFRF